MTDREMLDGLRRGEPAAFDAIFRTWYAPLVRMAESLVHEPMAAEEVVQDVMLELWRRRAVLAVAESLRAYLFQSTRNRALNHLRRRRVERRGEPQVARTVPESAPEADAALGEAELVRAIDAAVGALPPRCREVFELSRVHGLRYTEIASVLEISVKTVEAQMGKALRLLRERLAPWIGGEAAGRSEPDQRPSEIPSRKAAS